MAILCLKGLGQYWMPEQEQFTIQYFKQTIPRIQIGEQAPTELIFAAFGLTSQSHSQPLLPFVSPLTPTKLAVSTLSFSA